MLWQLILVNWASKSIDISWELEVCLAPINSESSGISLKPVVADHLGCLSIMLCLSFHANKCVTIDWKSKPPLC